MEKCKKLGKYQNVSIFQFIMTIILIFYMKHNSLLCFYVSFVEMIFLLLLHFMYYVVKLKLKYAEKRLILLCSFFVNLYVICWTYFLLFLVFQNYNIILLTIKIILNIFYLKNWGKLYLRYIDGSRNFFPDDYHNINFDHKARKEE